jgi:hypothetical protein
MINLYINSTLCDTFGNEEVVLNRSVNNIGDIQSRQGDYTNNFDLPLTPTNKLIFENSHVLNSASDIPYQRLPARIEVNGNIISMGYAVLIESSDVYRVSYYGANADVFATIGDKKLSELDLSEFNHLWTAVNVRAARLSNTTWTDAYNYPNVDYGPWQVGPTVYWTDFYIGFFEKYLVWKIFQEAGFTITGDFFDNNSDFAKGFIPFCSRFVRDRNYDNRNSGEWDTPSSTFNGLTYDLLLTNTVSQSDYNILNDETGIITILDNCALTFRIKVTVTNTDILPQAFAFQMNYTDSSGTLQNEVIIDNTTDPLDIPIPAGATKTFELTLTRNISRTTITFEWLMLLNPNTAISVCEFEIIDYVVDESTDSYLVITDVFNYITPASTLPDMKQTDLLLTWVNQFCLMFDTDHQTNYVNVFSFTEVLGNIPNARDMSTKIDLSNKPVISYKIGEYAQTNRFLYKDDPENEYLLAAPEFGSGEITIDNENIEVEKVVFQSEFASIIRQSESFSGTARFAFIPKFPAGDEVDCAPYIGVIEFETIHLVTMDGYALETTQPAMHEIGFSYLIPLYYTVLTSIFNDTKVVNILINLNNVDINQMDFSIPWYIEYFGAYFYVNEIKQFKVTSVESTLVELVRI